MIYDGNKMNAQNFVAVFCCYKQNVNTAPNIAWQQRSCAHKKQWRRHEKSKNDVYKYKKREDDYDEIGNNLLEFASAICTIMIMLLSWNCESRQSIEI